MAKLTIVLLLLGVLIMQVSAIESTDSDNETDIDSSNDEHRLLLAAALARKCRASVNRASSILPSIMTITLTRLANNRLYYFSPAMPAANLVTFDQARTFCIDHGMHLVTINTERENLLVFSRAQTLGLAGIGGTAPGAWIGYRDATGTNIYKWVQPGVGSTPTFFGAVAPAANLCVTYDPAVVPAATSWLPFVCTLPTRAFICELEPPCSLVL